MIISSRHIKWIVIFTAVLVLVAIYYPAFAQSIGRAAAEHRFNDDVRQYIWPTFVYAGESPFNDDYVTNYFFDLMPIGFKATYFTVSQFIHPRIFSKILPYILLCLTLLVSCMSSYRLAGPFAAFATLILGLSGSEYILDLTAGGLPRSFKFLPLSMVIYALITQRPYWIAFVTVISASFYPPVAILSGVVLTLYLLFPSKFGGLESALPTQQRLLIIAIAAIVSITILVPNLMALTGYGTKINIYNTEQIERFPERLDRQPINLTSRKVSLESVGEQSYKSLKKAFQGSEKNMYLKYFSSKSKTRDIVNSVWIFLTLLGALMLWRTSHAVRRLWVFFFATYSCAFLALILYPLVYYPSRYLDSSLFLIMLVVIPAAAGAIFSFIYTSLGWHVKRKLQAEMLLSVLLLVLLYGNKGPSESGLLVRIDGKDKPLYQFVRTLPTDVVIAGWPSDGEMKNIPYYTNRKVLLNREIHLCFHEDYALEMRHRWELLVSSYFTPDTESTQRMVKEYGVSHLLIKKAYMQGQKTPHYFAAFEQDIKQYQQNIELSGTHIVFENAKYYILQL